LAGISQLRPFDLIEIVADKTAQDLMRKIYSLDGDKLNCGVQCKKWKYNKIFIVLFNRTFNSLLPSFKFFPRDP